MISCKDCGHPLENHNVGSHSDRCAECACYAPTDRAEHAQKKARECKCGHDSAYHLKAVRRAAIPPAKIGVLGTGCEKCSCDQFVPLHSLEEERTTTNHDWSEKYRRMFEANLIDGHPISEGVMLRSDFVWEEVEEIINEARRATLEEIVEWVNDNTEIAPLVLKDHLLEALENIKNK